MFMGLFAHMFGVSSVLFTDQRVGDVADSYGVVEIFQQTKDRNIFENEKPS